MVTYHGLWIALQYPSIGLDIYRHQFIAGGSSIQNAGIRKFAPFCAMHDKLFAQCPLKSLPNCSHHDSLCLITSPKSLLCSLVSPFITIASLLLIHLHVLLAQAVQFYLLNGTDYN